MIITRLASENVKRISAVQITPEGPVVRIAGKNGAGKSSVLDSIAYALGGKTLIPVQPIKDGEAQAKIVVDIEGDKKLQVTRTFSRTKLPCDCFRATTSDGGVTDHHIDCASNKFGEWKSELVVSSDGAFYRKPQEVLDALYSALTFDPLEFAAMGKTPNGRREQMVILRDMAGLNFEEIDGQIQSASDRRASFNKQAKQTSAVLGLSSVYGNVPDIPIGAEELGRELAEAERLREVANKIRGRLDTATRDRTSIAAIITDKKSRISLLEKELIELKESLTHSESTFDKANKEVVDHEAWLTKAQAAVPDAAALKARLTEVDQINQKIRANAIYATTKQEMEKLTTSAQIEDAMIESLRLRREQMIREATFPVPGLGLTDVGVTLNNHPLEQAATSEQIRLSIAVGLARTKLKVLLIRNGNALDSESLATVAKMAEEAGAQLWMEWVADDSVPGAVVIEDGHVKE